MDHCWGLAKVVRSSTARENPTRCATARADSSWQLTGRVHRCNGLLAPMAGRCSYTNLTVHSISLVLKVCSHQILLVEGGQVVQRAPLRLHQLIRVRWMFLLLRRMIHFRSCASTQTLQVCPSCR